MFKAFLQNFSVTKLRDDLVYWIFINCGEDIIVLRDQRIEYQHLVKEAKLKMLDKKLTYAEIPLWVQTKLDLELKNPWYKRPTFWHLVKLYFKKKMRIL